MPVEIIQAANEQERKALQQVVDKWGYKRSMDPAGNAGGPLTELFAKAGKAATADTHTGTFSIDDGAEPEAVRDFRNALKTELKSQS